MAIDIMRDEYGFRDVRGDRNIPKCNTEEEYQNACANWVVEWYPKYYFEQGVEDFADIYTELYGDIPEEWDTLW